MDLEMRVLREGLPAVRIRAKVLSGFALRTARRRLRLGRLESFHERIDF
jgi:hypothetical protein